MNPLQMLFGALLAVSVLVTVLGYRRKYGALSGRSRLFRTAGMGMINLLLVVLMVFFGMNRQEMLAAGGDPRVFALRQVVMLLVITFLILSLVGLAALDVLENVVVYRRERRQAFQQMIRDEIEAQAQKRAERGAAATGASTGNAPGGGAQPS